MKVSFLNDAFFSRLERLSFNLKSDLIGYFGGKHLVRTKGQTVEFADFREYQLGDDIRRIDWNLYSRFEKYFIKLFTDERQMHVNIFLDCSASMGRDNNEKASFSIATAAAIGYLAVHNMDKVSFNIMQGEKSVNNFGTIIGKNAFFRALNAVQEIEFEDEADLEKCVTSCQSINTANGISVIISDFFTSTNWKKAVDYLCYLKNQVLLVQVMSPDDLDPLYDGRVDLIDSESIDLSDSKNMRLNITRSMQKAYQDAMADFKQDIKDFCLKRGVDFITLSSNSSIERGLFGELLKVGILK